MPRLQGNTLEKGDPTPIREQGDLIFGSDPDENQSDFAFYRRLGATHLDLNPLTQERMQQIAVFLWRRNPYAHRILKLVAGFAAGGGVRFSAEHRKVQRILTEHWNHPINNWDWRVQQIAFELGLYGEVFQTANVINPEAIGDVTWGVIDPLRVKKVTPDERDLSQPDLAHVALGSAQSGTTPTGETKPLKIIRYDGIPDSETRGFRVGQVMFHKTNGLFGALRGMSDLFPLADYLDFIDQFMFALQQRAQLQNTFVWDVELQGKSEQDIKEWLSRNSQPPGPGSIRAHNERVKWDALSPNLGASESGEHLRLSRNYVLSGAGLADWIMGDMGSANRAATENSAAVIARTMEQRQKEIKQVIEDVFNFVIDQKIRAGQLPRRRFNRTFYVSLPKIPIRDVQRLANSFKQVAQGVEIFRGLGAIDDERMKYLTSELINMLDLEGSDRFAERDPQRAFEDDAEDEEDPGDDELSRRNGRNPRVSPVSPAPREKARGSRARRS